MAFVAVPLFVRAQTPTSSELVFGWDTSFREGPSATAPATPPVRIWRHEELAQFHQTQSQEKDPITGKNIRWTGVSLALLVERTLASLTPEVRAQIDLLVLRGEGHQALVPRAFLSKFPILVALKKDQTDLASAAGEGPYYSVAPVTSHPKVTQEGLPVETFFVPGLNRIEFANSSRRYSRFFLKRRTDPVALRGEKLFVQNCIACHEGTTTTPPEQLFSAQRSRAVASSGHPPVRGTTQLTDRDRRSLTSYFDFYRSENPEVQAAAPTHAAN